MKIIFKISLFFLVAATLFIIIPTKVNADNCSNQAIACCSAISCNAYGPRRCTQSGTDCTSGGDAVCKAGPLDVCGPAPCTNWTCSGGTYSVYCANVGNVCQIPSGCTWPTGSCYTSTSTPTPSPGSTPPPGGGGSCSPPASCFVGIANCGVVGRPGGGGSCAGGLCCDPPNLPAKCNFYITVNGTKILPGQTITVTQGSTAAVQAFPTYSNGVVSSFAFSSAFTNNLVFNPPTADWVCVHTINWPPVCDRYRPPPAGWITTAYGKIPTNGVVKNGATVNCWVVDHGGINQVYDIQVLPINAGGGPGGGGGTAWWQVVNGDVIAAGTLNSQVPAANSSNTIYNDTDTPPVIYTKVAGNWVYEPFITQDLIFDDHYTPNLGNSVSLPFNGTSVTVVYRTLTNAGFAKVYIDNVQVDTLSERVPPPALYQQTKTYTVPAGSHTIMLTTTKVGNAYGNFYIDGFKVNSGPSNLAFDMPPLLTGYPGVAMYSGNYDFTSDSATQGSPSEKGWLVNSTYDGKDYTGQYFLDNLSTGIVFNNLPAGVVDGATLGGGGQVSPDGFYWYKSAGSLTINNPTIIGGTRKVVLLVQGGSLTLNGNITITNPGQGTFIALATSAGGGGGMTINPAVTTLNGIFFADGGVTTGVGSTQLNVVGSVVAHGGITLQRDLGAGNSNSAAEVFTFDPRLTLLFPNSLSIHRVRWKEIQP